MLRSALSVVLATCTLSALADDHRLEIRTLSTPADRVSGGDVLVEISNVRERSKHPLVVTLNGRDISAAFRPGSESSSRIGLVTGLELGKNKLSAGGKGQPKDTLEITNYPLSGPITSGPHITPFFCQTHQFRLPDGTFYTAQPVTDPSCAAPTRVTYIYMPVGATAFVPLPSGPLPPNVANTTTTTGATVRFIVRVETSTINRGIYQSAVLHDPTVDAPPGPFAAPRGWNRRLI